VECHGCRRPRRGCAAAGTVTAATQAGTAGAAGSKTGYASQTGRQRRRTGGRACLFEHGGSGQARRHRPRGATRYWRSVCEQPGVGACDTATQGAIDFVDKTRSFAVILKRLELALAGAKGTSSAPAPSQSSTLLGRLQLDLDSARAYWNGNRVDLSVTEFKVVHALVDRGGRDLSYRQIYDLVRGEGFQAGSGAEGYRGNVRAMVKRIRQKFRTIDSTFEALQNYPGFGYRWSDGERG
jgi:hypothetical protein